MAAASRKDSGASARLAAVLDTATAWSRTLSEADRARPIGATQRSVGSLIDALAALRRAAPAGAAAAEARAVSWLQELAETLPANPPPIARAHLAGAVRTTLARLAELHPGHLVEVRVPPWGAVQIGVPGVASVHRRGTPPNVVECQPAVWLALADGRLTWPDAVASGVVSASGSHADLGDLLPIP